MSKNFSLVVEKNGKIIFRSREHKLLPLVRCIKENNISGAKVFDKIVGGAAARLFVYAHVKEVRAGVASKMAIEILRKNKIKTKADEIVNHITKNDGKMCPFEKMSMRFRSNKKFYEELVKRFGL